MSKFLSFWPSKGSTPNKSSPRPAQADSSDGQKVPQSDAEQLQEQMKKTLLVVRNIAEKETAKAQLVQRNVELEAQNSLLKEDMKALNADIWTLEARLTAIEERTKHIDCLYMSEKRQRQDDQVQHKLSVNSSRERYQQLLQEKNMVEFRNKELEKLCSKLQRYEEMIVKCGEVALAERPRKRKRSAIEDEPKSESADDDSGNDFRTPGCVVDSIESSDRNGNDSISVSSTVSPSYIEL